MIKIHKTWREKLEKTEELSRIVFMPKIWKIWKMKNFII